MVWRRWGAKNDAVVGGVVVQLRVVEERGFGVPGKEVIERCRRDVWDMELGRVWCAGAEEVEDGARGTGGGDCWIVLRGPRRRVAWGSDTENGSSG